VISAGVESESEGRIERAECYLHHLNHHPCRWWLREQEEMRVLRGVVYMTKSSGPRTEPRGHRRRMCAGDSNV